MKDRHAERFDSLVEAVLATPGALDPAVRRTLEAHARALGADPPAGVGEELGAYAEKVARRAYTVSDGDVEALRAAGYSDDAIFEATLAAALGAARGRLERGLEALS